MWIWASAFLFLVSTLLSGGYGQAAVAAEKAKKE